MQHPQNTFTFNPFFFFSFCFLLSFLSLSLYRFQLSVFIIIYTPVNISAITVVLFDFFLWLLSLSPFLIVSQFLEYSLCLNIKISVCRLERTRQKLAHVESRLFRLCSFFSALSTREGCLTTL